MSAGRTDAETAWIAYRDRYMRENRLNGRRASSQMRRREFIAGYEAARAAAKEASA